MRTRHGPMRNFFLRQSALSQYESARTLHASRAKFWEEGGDDVKSAWPSDALGNTRATMAGTKGSQTARWSKSQKASLSSDWSLQLDSMKPESLVIVDQNATVNTFSDLVLTARHTKRVGNTGRPCFKAGTRVGSMIRVKS